MKTLAVNRDNNNTNFGMKFTLSGKTLGSISRSTKLSIDELQNLSLSEVDRLMKERGAYKEPSKLKQWFAAKYKEFGEKTGLLKREVNIYTDVD